MCLDVGWVVLADVVLVRVVRGGILCMTDGQIMKFIFGIYVAFMRKEEVFRNFASHEEEGLSVPLLSVIPLGKEVRDELNCEEEATRFDAKNQVNHMTDIFFYYTLSLNDRVLCSTADKCGVNKRIAKILGVLHMRCMSHKLNLEV